MLCSNVSDTMVTPRVRLWLPALYWKTGRGAELFPRTHTKHVAAAARLSQHICYTNRGRCRHGSNHQAELHRDEPTGGTDGRRAAAHQAHSRAPGGSAA